MIIRQAGRQSEQQHEPPTMNLQGGGGEDDVDGEE